MQTGWSLTDNPFENSTRKSFRKMLSMGQYTDAALQGMVSDPFFAGLHAAYHPVMELYRMRYSKHGNARGKRKSETYRVKQLLKELSNDLIGKWAVSIYIHYRKGTPRCEALLPLGTRPFHNGSREARINAVKTLAKSIGSDVNLAALKAEVEAFALQLETASSTQQGDKGGAKMASLELEKQRKALAVALLVVYGNLLAHFAEKPEQLENYFDHERIRSKRQKTFTRHLKPHQSKTVVKRTLAPDAPLKLKNTGNAELLIGLCPDRNMRCENGVSVSPHSEAEVQAHELGNVEREKYITVTNNTDAEGGCIVTLL